MILFWYVLKDFLRYVVGIVILCLFLFIMFDFIHKSTKYFSTYKPRTDHVIQFYLMQIPNQMVQALPIASLLASVICMVLLSRTNEITAMRAAGMSPEKILAPLAVGGAILCAISFVMGEFILPITAKRMHFVEQVLIKGDSPTAQIEGSRWLRSGNVLYNFGEYDPAQRKIVDLRVIVTGLNFRPRETLEASSAKFNDENELWELRNIRVLQFNPNGTLASTEVRDSQMISIPIQPEKLQKERRRPEEMGLFELYDNVRRGRAAGLDVSNSSVELHFKFAFYFAAFVVSLIGIRFGYRSERTVETAKGVLVAVGVGISYWFIMNAGRAFGKRGVLDPLIAAWLANVIIFCFGAYELWSIKRARS